MKKDDSIYLQLVLDAILTLEEYLQGVNEEDFKATRLLQDGAIRQIEIIGEAVMHISKDIRNTYSEIPWEEIAGRRATLIHDYFDIDVEKVWYTAQEDLPVLKRQVVGILKDFGFE